MLTPAQQQNQAKHSHLASPARSNRADMRSTPIGNPLIAKQQSLGNQAVQRLLRSGVIQAKLKINEPGDIPEQEADRVAEQVMRMPDPGATNEAPIPGQTQSIQIQRMCSECEEDLYRQPMEEEGAVFGEIQTPGIQRVCSECEEDLHRQPLEGDPLDEEEVPIASGMPAGASGEAPQLVKNHLTNLGSGHHLPEPIRAFFEPRFGDDFSQVRVHTDSSAAESARAINARAFTVGRDVVFGAGQYTPETVEGKKLLAHELAHVVQQQKGGVGSLQPHLAVSSIRDFYETEAGRVAERVMSGDRQVASTLTPVKPSVQRACGPAIGPAVGCT